MTRGRFRTAAQIDGPRSNSPKNAANRSGRALANLTHGRTSRREKEGFIVPSRSLDARRQACDDATRATFSHQKIPPPRLSLLPIPLVDDATCDDAGGSVTDAHFRVQSNPDSKEGGSGLTEEVRDSSVKERGFLLFAATHMPPSRISPSCSLSCVLSFKSRTSHTRTLSLTHTPSLGNFAKALRKITLFFGHRCQRME